MPKGEASRLIRANEGFTLIELLVVVLIIGILASIAIPQYFKVVERARLAEAQSLMSEIKDANERYLARYGNYAYTDAMLTNLDITFAGAPPTFGMQYYSATAATSSNGCQTGNPGYNLVLSRVAVNAGVASRYNSGYSVLYERCLDVFSYPGCANCASDFAQ